MHTADLPGELRVADGHEGGHLLVPRLDEGDPVIVAVEGAQEAVDAVAGVAEDVGDAPLREPLEDLIADVLGHVDLHEGDGEAERACSCSPRRATAGREAGGVPLSGRRGRALVCAARTSASAGAAQRASAARVS